MEAHYYNTNIEWKTDRKGVASSTELNTTFEVATPPQFPQGMSGIWSPEHLFTLSVSSCLMTTFLAIAENSKLEFVTFTCPAKGRLEQVDGKFLMTEVELYPEVTVKKEADKEKAERILQKAEVACLISNSVKAKVIMKPTIKI